MSLSPRQFIKKWKLSLGAKFTLLVSGVLLVTMGGTAILNYQSQNRLFLEHLQSKGIMLGEVLAEISPEAILSYDFITLNEYVHDVSRQKDVVYAVYISPQNKPLNSYIDTDNPYISKAIGELHTFNPTKIIKHVNTDPRIMVLEFPILFNKQHLGDVVIGMDRTRIESLSRHELLKQMLGNGFIILFLSICIYVVFRYNTLQPIHALIHGSERVAKGELEEKVLIESNDEIGNLAQSFNEMMGKLKKSTSEKDQALAQLKILNKTLESRVEKRTRELEILNRELEHQALHDSLTDLPNRALVQDRVQQAIIRAARNKKTFAVIMLDLDRFKEINDTLGHDVGDQLLKEVGQRLRSVVREVDTVGRIGGDEYFLILPGADRHAALQVANKILNVLEPSFLFEEISFSVSASMGIALYPDHGKDTATLFKRADVAMYAAKQNKSGYFVYSSEKDSHSPDHLALIGELRNAIEHDELQLFYQPIINQFTGRIFGVEALSRWPHPQNGLIEPSVFIPPLEQTSLIKAFTYWVLKTAFRQWSEWHDAGITVNITINLSMRNLHDPQLTTHIRELLDEWNVDEGCILLEITESDVMHDPPGVMNILNQLETMGLQLAIDDFGTGYSSLSYLKKLPVHIIKIDQSFVVDMDRDRDNSVIVHSTIDLAHNLGLKVIAEGIENQEVMHQLKALNCDFAQGYYLCKPLAADKIVEFIKCNRATFTVVSS